MYNIYNKNQHPMIDININIVVYYLYRLKKSIMKVVIQWLIKKRNLINKIVL